VKRKPAKLLGGPYLSVYYFYILLHVACVILKLLSVILPILKIDIFFHVFCKPIIF